MEQVTVVIPTRNRWQKLKTTINSIPRHDWIMVHVGFDDTKWIDVAAKYFDTFLNTWFDQISWGENKGAVYVRNRILETAEDGALCATDDIVFKKGSIEAAFESFNKHFPDDDGVIGFVQEGVPDYHPTGVVLVGQKWLQRYPNKHMYCPQYFHFSCQEILWLAEKYNKFHLEDKARLIHYHPSFHKELADTTHEEARKFKKQDMALIKMRKKAGLIWGDNG